MIVSPIFRVNHILLKPMTARIPLFALVLLSTVNHLFAQELISGPMVGYGTMTEVAIWVQTKDDSKVSIDYWEKGKRDSTLTSTISSAENLALTYEFHISKLKPGKTYEYTILINDKLLNESANYSFNTQPLWQFRTDPPEFSVALGSCNYVNEPPYDRPGKIFGGNHTIFNTIADKAPNMMLWLGDNIYLREVDWNSRSGYIHRYTHTRSIPELQRLLSSCNNYAIWDDHDFGPNDANGSWIHKDWALETFDMFWANPTTGLPELKGITTAFEYVDIDFFLLDNRYHRSADNLIVGQTEIIGNEQIEWLIQFLKYSRAPFKMVAIGGQVLNTAPVYETHAVYSEERKYLIRRIVEEQVEGVVFLTGDRHHTELSRYEDESGIIIYDLTVSPLTAGTHKDDKEENKLRVENTLVNERNFGLITFCGPRRERQMKISIFDSDGDLIWNKIIDQNE